MTAPRPSPARAAPRRPPPRGALQAPAAPARGATLGVAHGVLPRKNSDCRLPRRHAQVAPAWPTGRPASQWSRSPWGGGIAGGIAEGRPGRLWPGQTPRLFPPAGRRKGRDPPGAGHLLERGGAGASPPFPLGAAVHSRAAPPSGDSPHCSPLQAPGAAGTLGGRVFKMHKSSQGSG